MEFIHFSYRMHVKEYIAIINKYIFVFNGIIFINLLIINLYISQTKFLFYQNKSPLITMTFSLHGNKN